MTKQGLIDNMREMVKYILPDECRDDNDIVDNYTDTMVMIAEEYHTEQLKLYNVVGRSEQLKCHHQYMNAGTLQGYAMKKCLRCGDYVKAL
jgi:hypothetical protein